MRNSTTQVNYEVLDQCISNLNQKLNDTYVQKELEALQQIFEKSKGKSAEELLDASYNLEEANQIIEDMMAEAMAMLAMAKELFREADTLAVSGLEGGDE